jgi:acetyl esterase/lipase
MDIFQPVEKDSADPGHGLAIVDVASGAWFSDRGKIEDHKKAKFYDIFTEHGYTVFAVRPGTRGKFTALEMVDHIKHAIRYIKANADEYGIDPDRIGITGPSAGGHLASLVALTPEPGDPNAEDPLLRHGTEVKAAGIFFPPADFLDWDGGKNAHERLGDLYFKGGIKDRSPEEIAQRAREISPRHQVKGKTPPFLIYHGDADPLVPLQQSEVLVQALKEHGNDVKFIVVPGGAHPWPTIDEEVAEMADWFDKVLAGRTGKAAAAGEEEAPEPGK